MSLLDQDTLESLRDLQSEDDPDFLKNYFNLFLKPVSALAKSIRQSIETSNYAELAMSAHALKSSSSNSGITVVSKICADLEKLGHDKSTEGALPMCIQLEQYLIDVEAEIKSLPEFRRE